MFGRIATSPQALQISGDSAFGDRIHGELKMLGIAIEGFPSVVES